MRSFLLWAAFALAAASPLGAEIDGHGPDAYRVTGVASEDVLNMRMGPGIQYLVIDSLPPNARGLQQVTCVPLQIPSIYYKLTEEQRNNLPQRWCLMRTSDLLKAGWVAQRYLMEDVDLPNDTAETDPENMPVHHSGDAMIDAAARLVGDLYAAYEGQSSAGLSPFSPGQAPRFFFSGIAPRAGGHGADVLYDAQDFQGRITKIAADPDQPMLRGMVTIIADYTNFGHADRATFRLRADTAQPGAPVRIFRIEHDSWSFP